MLVGGFFAASYGAGLALAEINPSCASGLEKMADRQERGGQIRLELWRQAIDVWRTSPWIGIDRAAHPSGRVVNRPMVTNLGCG